MCVRLYVYGSVCAGRERCVLHVISFEANIRLSFVGISARDARVAVEVVYHHSFLVFEQRSVQESLMMGRSVKTNLSRTAYLWGKGKGKGRERKSMRFFVLGDTVSGRDDTCPSKNFCILVKRCFPSTHSLVS